MSVKPIDRLTLQLGALFTSPDLHQVEPTFSSGRSDFTLPGVPRRSINGQVSYEIPLGGDRTLALEATALYVGHSYLFFGPQEAAAMGDYLDARLGAALKLRLWTMGLTVENPANSRADTFAFGNPFSLQNGPQMTPLRPRTLKLTVSRTF